MLLGSTCPETAGIAFAEFPSRIIFMVLCVYLGYLISASRFFTKRLFSLLRERGLSLLRERGLSLLRERGSRDGAVVKALTSHQ